MNITIKDYFKQFLHGYISAGNTVCDESEKEVKHIISDFADTCQNSDCFTYPVFCDFIYYINARLSDDYKRLYTLFCSDDRYSDLLEDYLKHLFE